MIRGARIVGRWRGGLVLIVVLILLALLAGCSQLFPAKPPPAKPRAVPAVVKKGTITVTVKANGAVTTPGQVALTAPASATLISLHVIPGQHVKVGQALGKIDTTTLDAAVTQAKLTVKAAQAKLDTMTAGPRPETVIQAKAVVSQGQATLDADLAKLTALQNGPRTATVTQARTALAQARATRDADTVQTANAVAAAKASVAVAGLKLKSVQESAPGLLALAQTSVQTAKDGLFAAQTSRDGECGGSKPAYRCQAANAQVNAATDGVNSAALQVKQQEIQNRANLQSAQAAVSQAQSALKDAQAAQTATLAKDAASIAAARAALALAENPYTAADLTQAKAAITRDRAGLRSAEAGVSLAKQPYTSAAVQQLRLIVTQANAALSAAEALRKRSTLTSPVDGAVVSVPAAVGNYLSSGATIATFVPSGVTTVAANVSEFDVRKLALHDPVSVKIDGFPGKKLHGEVTGISVLPLTVQGVVFYPVTITVKNPKNLTLRAGMTMRTTITTVVHRNVLVLPNAAIGQLNGSEAVLAPVAGGAPAWKPVQVGIHDHNLTEIQSGLALGATVLIPGSAGQSIPAATSGSGSAAKPVTAPPGIGVPSGGGGQGGQH